MSPCTTGLARPPPPLAELAHHHNHWSRHPSRPLPSPNLEGRTREIVVTTSTDSPDLAATGSAHWCSEAMPTLTVSAPGPRHGRRARQICQRNYNPPVKCCHRRRHCRCRAARSTCCRTSPHAPLLLTSREGASGGEREGATYEGPGCHRGRKRGARSCSGWLGSRGER